MSDLIPLPPDRSHLDTEQRNPRSMNLHQLSVKQIVDLMNQEDQTVPVALQRAQSALTAFIEAVEVRFNQGGRLIYVGAGTSGRLGVLDASEMPPTFQIDPGRVVGIIAGGDAALRRSSEGIEDDATGTHDEIGALDLKQQDSLLGIAAGGTTPYVMGALAFAKQRDLPPLTGLLVCTPIERPPFVDHLISVETGSEVVTGSTRMKAGSATKLVLNTISTTLMVRSGRVYENLMVDLRATNEKLRDRAARIVVTITGLNRQDCFELLDRADGDVKTAIVMHERGVGPSEAQRRLAQASGLLDRVLDSHL